VQSRQQGSAPLSFRRPAFNAVSVQRARHFGTDPMPQWRAERDAPWVPRAHHFDRHRTRFEPGWRPASRRDTLDHRLLQFTTGALIVCLVSCFWLLTNEFSSLPAGASSHIAVQARPAAGSLVANSGKLDSLAVSAHLIDSRPARRRDIVGAIDPASEQAESPAAIIARTWSIFESKPQRASDEGSDPVKPAKGKPPVRIAALESPAPQIASRPWTALEPVLRRLPPPGEPKTILADFETAPFPYDGKMPGSNRPFLDAGQPGHRGHTTFRGRVLWESETFSDRRVLLHIPPAFDPNRPGVMIVFFHGHGANLARDVRDRQQVPAQLSASGVNAVLVAPQFAFNAADSSAGKFWEPGGFKRFVDEAADQLAKLHGDSRTKRVFANMPIVIVAYSGGFGPTLSVLDRGSVKSRLRGIVLLDALYSGMPKFANWIANDRSTFFVSSYTPHTRSRNVELEQMLRDKSVSYGSELRHSHLAGSVTFLPTGNISHRDFVNRAWVDSPLKDILLRLDEYAPRVATATDAPAMRPPATATAAKGD